MKKKLLAGLATGIFMFGLIGMAEATTLTFDDIGTGGQVYNGYGGLDWGQMAYENSFGRNDGYGYGLVSGEYVAYNWYANVATVGGSLFDFNGAYLTGAWNNGLTIDVTGYLSGVQSYSRTVTVDTTSATWFDFNFLGVDSLSFHSYGGTDAGYGGHGAHFAMDNFTFNEAAPVPEPATMLLFGIGLAGLVGNRIRRKKD